MLSKHTKYLKHAFNYAEFLSAGLWPKGSAERTGGLNHQSDVIGLSSTWIALSHLDDSKLCQARLRSEATKKKKSQSLREMQGALKQRDRLIYCTCRMGHHVLEASRLKAKSEQSNES